MYLRDDPLVIAFLPPFGMFQSEAGPLHHDVHRHDYWTLAVCAQATDFTQDRQFPGSIDQS